MASLPRTFLEHNKLDPHGAEAATAELRTELVCRVAESDDDPLDARHLQPQQQVDYHRRAVHSDELLRICVRVQRRQACRGRHERLSDPRRAASGHRRRAGRRRLLQRRRLQRRRLIGRRQMRRRRLQAAAFQSVCSRGFFFRTHSTRPEGAGCGAAAEEAEGRVGLRGAVEDPQRSTAATRPHACGAGSL